MPDAALVTIFEQTAGFDVIGGYDGIIPANFRFGPLLDYFLGAQDHSYWSGVGKIALLGCSCGEVGCWPLYASVRVSPTSIGWHDFEQPYRAARDYSGFGPFEFARTDFEEAVQAAVAALPSRAD